jgi:outer membrane protein OmpA-like peptidoglycan-associated protein
LGAVLVFGVTAMAFSPPPAHGQAIEPVSVDLGAIEDRGYAPLAPGASGASRIRQLPPKTHLVSTLHVAPPQGTAAAAKPVPRVNPSTPAPAPAAAPARSAPKPRTAEPPPPPAKPVETVRAEPLAPPKPAAAAPPRPAAPAAPEVVAPPPPPTTTPPPVATAKVAPKVPQASPEQAARTPGAMTLLPGSSLKLTFAADVAKVSEPEQEKLIALAEGLKGRNELRVQLLAYAGGESLSSSKARRLSLSRALAVRSLLIDNGVRSTRIDVRALGNKTTEEPVNRVDVIVAER